MTTFERQLAGGFESLMGPSEPVDDLAVFEAIAAADRPPNWGYSMFSAVKYVAAVVIVALSAGFLLAGVLTTQQDDEPLPATETESPSPVTGGVQAFPTGAFVSDEDDLTIEFRTDGTCERAGVPCIFGVVGNRYSEMTFEDPSGPQMPATYFWAFDGESLTFEPWGEDQRPDRGALYGDHVFRPQGETVPLPVWETDFPIGVFDPVDGSGTQLSLRENATVAVGGILGKHVVNGDLFTEMTHNSNIARKVPATYYWRWDGERLSFRPWGEDGNAGRKSAYADVYARQQSATGDVRRLLLSDPRLDYWVTVEVQEQGGRYTARATIDDGPPGSGDGDTIQEAVEAALKALDVPYASEMAEDVPG